MEDEGDVIALHQRIGLQASQAALTRALSEVDAARTHFEGALGRDHEISVEIDNLRDDLRVVQARIARLK